jgi:hypothetical protein
LLPAGAGDDDGTGETVQARDALQKASSVRRRISM